MPQAPHSSSAFSIQRSFAAVRPVRDCHQTQVWQTEGACSSVAPVSADDALCHLVHDDVDAVGADVGHAGEVLGDVRLHLGADGARAGAPVEREVQLDADLAVVARDLDALVAVERAPDEAVHAGDLDGRVGGVAREHVGGDDGVALHQPDLRRTSSVTSGRAKKRNGTNVVPRPGETCSVTPPSR